MAAPLTSAEARVLGQASGLLARGGAREAREKLAPLIRSGARNLDLLLTYAGACEQLGLTEEAATAVRLAVQEEPQSALLWARFGTLLEDLGRSFEAVTALERSVALDPGDCASWYNLGVAAISANQLARALEALQRAVALAPLNAPAWAALGLVQQQSGDVERSQASLRRALDLDPSLLTAAHNLAVTLRLLDRSPEALALIEDALGRGLRAPESKLMRAHLLADTGKLDDSVAAYRALGREAPSMLEAHEALLNLLPQLGRPDEALSSYAQALGSAPTPELYRSALKAAWDLRNAEMLERWSLEALGWIGEEPDLLLMRALGHAVAGENENALRILDSLIERGFTPALDQAAYLRLKLGDLDASEELALAATRADFSDQAAWAQLTLIWRLKEDPREQWLANYEQLVMPALLEPPEGFADIELFMAAVAQELHGLHRTLHHPTDQSLRQGTQTRGNLFDKRTPLIRQLAASVQDAISGTIAKLPSDPTHPFLSRNSGRSRFLGSWSVRLRSGGFHVSHIHQLGWLSSALYVSLPPEMASGEASDVPQGSLAFGVPEGGLGLDLAPRRIELPQIGRLVLFPSYLWHGTIPFESRDYRLTVAFDAAPA